MLDPWKDLATTMVFMAAAACLGSIIGLAVGLFVTTLLGWT